MDDRLSALVGAMEDEVQAGPEIYQPSRFWTRLNTLHLDQLSDSGFASFKRTVNQSYYNWLLGLRDPQVRSLAAWWIRHPRPHVAIARLADWRGFESQSRQNPMDQRRRRWLYQMAVATLWEYARQRDRLGLLDHLEEPSVGRPIAIRYRGRRISQDLANSVLEFYSIAEAMGEDLPGSNGVLELGAGYGRLAWVYLSAFPDLRYFIVDIPPALALSQEYLTRLFPDRKTFRFRHFDTYDSVANEMQSARIGFLTPNQLEIVPAWEAGAFINISSLHEMRPDQVDAYTVLIDRHTSGVFYSKQWREWTNPNDGVTLRQEDYPIPKRWRPLYVRPHAIQSAFFEAAYRIEHAGA